MKRLPVSVNFVASESDLLFWVCCSCPAGSTLGDRTAEWQDRSDNVSSGSFASVERSGQGLWSAPVNGHRVAARTCLKSANKRHQLSSCFEGGRQLRRTYSFPLRVSI